MVPGGLRIWSRRFTPASASCTGSAEARYVGMPSELTIPCAIAALGHGESLSSLAISASVQSRGALASQKGAASSAHRRIARSIKFAYSVHAGALQKDHAAR